MASEYPSFLPYTYCANNPIKLVDPNGEEISCPDDPPKTIFQKSWEAFKKFDQSLEGHNDGANRGTITKQDVNVGMATIAVIVTAGAGLEAEGIVSAIVTGVSTLNNIDDATVNSDGQTFSQRTTEDNPTANKTVEVAKTASSAASFGSSITTVVKKGIGKAASSAMDATLSAYGFIKSFCPKKKSNGKS